MKKFHAPWNCSFGSHNVDDHEFTLKILFGNLYMEMNVIKISFLYIKSIMKLIIIITKEAAAAECYRHIHDFVKKAFRWAGENFDIILHW